MQLQHQQIIIYFLVNTNYQHHQTFGLLTVAYLFVAKGNVYHLVFKKLFDGPSTNFWLHSILNDARSLN